MATDLFTNLAGTTVTTGGTTAPVAGTVETWTVASSATFPAAVAGVSQFRVQEDDLTRQSEIMLVTNVSGTTWTVTRGVEGTAPVAHPANFAAVHTITAAALATIASTSLVQIPAGAAAQTVAVGSAYDITLSVASCLITPSGGTAGTLGRIELTVRQGAGGGRTVTWPSSVQYPGGQWPSLSQAANAVDRFQFTTTDGGVTFQAIQSSVNAKAATAPAQPAGPTLTAATTTVTVNVNPLGNGGAPVTSRRIYRSTVTAGEGTTPLATLAAGVYTYSDAGLTAGTTYFYTTDEVNAVGASIQSSESSIAVSATSPNLPPTVGVALKAFFEAGQITPVPANGASVSSWTDASPNAFVASLHTGDTAPTFDSSAINGTAKTALAWNNASRLDTTIPVTDGPYTVVSVAFPFTQVGAVVGSSVTGGFNMNLTPGNAAQKVTINFDSAVAGASTGVLTTGAWAVCGGSMSTPSGTNHAVKVSQNGAETVVATVSSTAASGTLLIGGHGTVTTERFVGRIAAIAVYQGELTSADRHSVEQYLATRYAITIV